ncbi:ImmA/IrrE family metallo-endopeptidase [Paenibacillus hamazuiensis]|uniref:ImmA/IrrE family metallo-endopeptidase n=1 Tax=Paenibacillus hamazuiensis TaxID=2936508 RepID=UPI0020106725|nr:ImmA/IrrE family metallo-endopeptidase [Paenibacillus hamazuiensis]
MKYGYKMTPLEETVSGMLQHLGITQPEQLEPEVIADKLDIWVHYAEMSSRALERGGMGSIILDSRLSREEQMEDFAHELCHILLHAGNQLVMPIDFIRLQEAKADQFAMHLCVPTFMLLALELPEHKTEAAASIASIFRVRPAFALRRLEHFVRQSLASRREDDFQAGIRGQDNRFRSGGIDFAVRTGRSTMLYSKERGVVGYVKEEADDAN